jgi:nitroreductase
MELRDVFKRRKSVRAFEQRPVPRDATQRVMSSVLHAPSAGFTQGNEFLVLDTPEGIARFVELTDDASDPYTDDDRAVFPPVIVVPLANQRAYTDRYSLPDKVEFGLGDAAKWPVPYWDVDAGMASMLILLAAIDEGLAGWFFGLTDDGHDLLQAFRVPDRFKPIGAIGIGYPAPERVEGSGTRRPRRGADELVHYGTWPNDFPTG